MTRGFITFATILASGAFARAEEPQTRESKSSVVTSPSPQAASQSGSSTEGASSSLARVERYLQAGSAGVFYREGEDTRDGRFLRVYVVGTATISTALGASEGLELARERAGESARAEFITWLGSRVTLRKSVEGEVQLIKEGHEDQAGEGASKETLRKVERRTTVYEETASSLVRGLKWVAGEDHPAEKRYVAVYRWDVTQLEAIKAARDELNRDSHVADGKGKDGMTGKAKGAMPLNKVLPGRKIIIDE